VPPLHFDNHPHANRCSKIATFSSGYVHHLAQKRVNLIVIPPAY
jgi:hypothetical protein